MTKSERARVQAQQATSEGRVAPNHGFAADGDLEAADDFIAKQKAKQEIPSARFPLDSPADQIEDFRPYYEGTKRTNIEYIFLDRWETKIVFRMNDSVIKFGVDVDLREAQNLRFIRETTSIPVPTVTKVGSNGFVMTYIEGNNLRDCWTQLSADEKASIVDHLRDMVQQLRSLKGTYIGSIDHGPARDFRKGDHTGGPFETEADFNNFVLRSLAADKEIRA